MEIGCGKQRSGSDCTIVSRFRKTSCWWTSTDSQRLRHRDPGAPALFFGCLAASIRTGAITPLLGGVGPMTIANLMHNTLIAASMQSGLGVPLFRQM
ncbi:hypothetical protein HFN03_05520 [Rhizobium leguminosarum]|nr:hypothetical protein [Rhizobium leguminosarum]